MPKSSAFFPESKSKNSSVNAVTDIPKPMPEAPMVIKSKMYKHPNVSITNGNPTLSNYTNTKVHNAKDTVLLPKKDSFFSMV
jgi:hypothetical protein